MACLTSSLPLDFSACFVCMNEYSDISDEDISSSDLENCNSVISELIMSSGKDLGSGQASCQAPGSGAPAVGHQPTPPAVTTAAAAAAATTTAAAASLTTTVAATGPNCSTVGPGIIQAGPSTVPAFSAGLPPSSIPAGAFGHQHGLSYGIPQPSSSMPSGSGWTPPSTTVTSLGNVPQGSFPVNFATPPATQSLPPGIPQMPPSMPIGNPWLCSPTALQQFRFPAPIAPWDMMPGYNPWPYFMPPMVSSVQYTLRDCRLCAFWNSGS